VIENLYNGVATIWRTMDEKTPELKIIRDNTFYVQNFDGLWNMLAHFFFFNRVVGN